MAVEERFVYLRLQVKGSKGGIHQVIWGGL